MPPVLAHLVLPVATETAEALYRVVDAAYPIAQLDKKLPEFLVDRDTLWHAVGHDAEWDARITKALNEVRAQTRAGKRAPRAIHDLRVESMPRAFRVLLDEPLDADGSIRLDANGSHMAGCRAG